MIWVFFAISLKLLTIALEFWSMLTMLVEIYCLFEAISEVMLARIEEFTIELAIAWELRLIIILFDVMRSVIFISILIILSLFVILRSWMSSSSKPTTSSSSSISSLLTSMLALMFGMLLSSAMTLDVKLLIVFLSSL